MLLASQIPLPGFWGMCVSMQNYSILKSQRGLHISLDVNRVSGLFLLTSLIGLWQLECELFFHISLHLRCQVLGRAYSWNNPIKHKSCWFQYLGWLTTMCPIPLSKWCEHLDKLALQFVRPSRDMEIFPGGREPEQQTSCRVSFVYCWWSRG